MGFGDPLDIKHPRDLPVAVGAVGLERYLIHARIDAINRALRKGSAVPPEHLRSPSPEPVYENERQTNATRIRYEQRLEEERQGLICEALELNPGYRAPAEQREGARYTDKVYIPADEYPDVNFIGLFIGPRGGTLKHIEQETRCKLSIKGKGAIKEVSACARAQEEEPLHCVVSADTRGTLEEGVTVIENIIESAISTPEADNVLKQLQLRELAELGGGEALCSRCGLSAHAGPCSTSSVGEKRKGAYTKEWLEDEYAKHLKLAVTEEEREALAEYYNRCLESIED